jgi:hypothetical protein
MKVKNRRWITLQDRRWVMGKDHAVRQEAGQDKKGDLISYLDHVAGKGRWSGIK